MGYDSVRFWLTLVFAGGPILMCFVSTAYSFYLIRRYLDQMLEALSNSSQFSVGAPVLLGQGWFGRMVLIAKIWGALGWSGPGIRAGVLDPLDIKQFPRHLRRLFIIKSLMTYLIIVWFASAYFVLDMGRKL